jgi:hypothetical protein
MINNSTGKQWSLNAVIPAGNVVQVITKPGSQSVVNLTTSVNIWDQLVLGTSIRNLWNLIPGDNQISITMAGATSATTVEIDWVNRWSRALWRSGLLSALRRLRRSPAAARG